ncbi:hypothetical protein [Leptospira borgpetersenii]|uniref:hypothetical protein n=1 Tax=Leptospira borgpetersenii TaxID=174 RepID=UPI001E497338|nr:hypothetical protein [Leptospira borgpetersenii]
MQSFPELNASLPTGRSEKLNASLPTGRSEKLNASLPTGRSENSMHRFLRVALKTQCIASYGSL